MWQVLRSLATDFLHPECGILAQYNYFSFIFLIRYTSKA